MSSLVELSKAMTKNKAKALRSATERLHRVTRGPGGARNATDRMVRDSSYADWTLDRHRRGQGVAAAYQRLERERRALAQFDTPRRLAGGGPSVDWRNASWRDSKRQTAKYVNEQRAFAGRDKDLAGQLANDQRLKPRRLP